MQSLHVILWIHVRMVQYSVLWISDCNRGYAAVKSLQKRFNVQIIIYNNYNIKINELHVLMQLVLNNCMEREENVIIMYITLAPPFVPPINHTPFVGN